MGSHSVTCHPTQVNVPRLHPSQYSIYLPRRDGRLCWPRLPGNAPAGNRTPASPRLQCPRDDPRWLMMTTVFVKCLFFVPCTIYSLILHVHCAYHHGNHLIRKTLYCKSLHQRNGTAINTCRGGGGGISKFGESRETIFRETVLCILNPSTAVMLVCLVMLAQRWVVKSGLTLHGVVTVYIVFWRCFMHLLSIYR